MWYFIGYRFFRIVSLTALTPLLSRNNFASVLAVIL